MHPPNGSGPAGLRRVVVVPQGPATPSTHAAPNPALKHSARRVDSASVELNRSLASPAVTVSLAAPRTAVAPVHSHSVPSRPLPQTSPAFPLAQPISPAPTPQVVHVVDVGSAAARYSAFNVNVTCFALQILMLITSLFIVVFASSIASPQLGWLGMAGVGVSIISLATSI